MGDNSKTRFKPGNPGGPGRPQVPPEVREGRRLTAESFQKLIDKCYYLDIEALEKLEQDRTIPAIEGIVVKIILQARKNSSLAHASFLLERMIGPVPKEIKAQVTGNLHGQLIAAIKQATDDEG